MEHAVLAVQFEGRSGSQRRGMFGARHREDGMWSLTGSFMSSPRVARADDVWEWGGWSGGGSGMAVAGGWVADLAGASIRVTDPAGRIQEDDVERGVAILMWKGEFSLRYAHAELLDANGHVLRTAPMRRSR